MVVASRDLRPATVTGSARPCACDPQRLQLAPAPLVRLRQEHEMLLRAVSALHPFATLHLEALPRLKLRRVVGNLRLLHSWHCEKEEALLWPALCDECAPSAGLPLAELRRHHDEFQRLLKALWPLARRERAWTPFECEIVARLSTRCREVLSEHVTQEETHLFPLAEDLLTEEACQKLSEQFQTLAAPGTGRDDQSLKSLVEDLLRPWAVEPDL